MTTIAIVLGVAALAALFVTLTVLDAGRWRKKMDDVLLPIGFGAVLEPAHRNQMAQQLTIVNPAHRGKRLLKQLYRRKAPDGDYDILVADYYFASGSGKARGSNWMLVCLESEALRLPRTSIQTIPPNAGAMSMLLGALTRAVDLPGLRRISTGDESLDRRVHVYLEPGRSQLPIQRDLLAPLCETAGGTSLDAKGGFLALSSLGMMTDRLRQVLDPQKLLAQIQLASRLHTGIVGTTPGR